MAKYIDVYLLPLPKKNLAAYKKIATAAGKIFRKHGALTYSEYVESDLKQQKGISAFPQVIKLKKGEVLVYSNVTFKSEAHRNKTMKAVFKDKSLEAMMHDAPVFEMTRMVYGGFKVLVDL